MRLTATAVLFLTVALVLPARAQDNAFDVQSICGTPTGNYEYGVYLNLYASQLTFSTLAAGEALSGVADDREMALYARDAVMGVVSLKGMVGEQKAVEAALSAFSGTKAAADEAGLTSLSETQDFMIDFGVGAASAIASGSPWELALDQGIGILINGFSAIRYYNLGKELRVYDAVGSILFPYYKSCKSIPYTAQALGYDSGYPTTRDAFFEWALDRIDDEYGLFEGFDPDAAYTLLTRYADEVPQVAASVRNRLSTPSQPTPVVTAVVPGVLVGSTDPQTITVRGTGFGPGTTLRFSDGATVYDRTPTYVDPTTLRYGITVGTGGGAWTVRAFNGASGSNTVSFQVEPAPDATAPGQPRDFNVYPLRWARENAFRAVWENPADQTGITRVWYKIGDPPTSPRDGTALDAERNMPLHFSLPGDRSSFVHVWLEDGEGNVDHGNRVSVPVKLDLGAPTLSITSPGANGTADTDQNEISVSGRVSDATSGVGRVVWLSSPLSEAGLASVGGGGSWSASDVPLAPGSNQVVVVAVDLAGNVVAERLEVNSNTGGGETYRLSLSTSGSGSIRASPERETYPAGSNVSLTAVPGDGYTFSGWSGDASGSANPLTVTMDADKSITARFTRGREQGAVTVTILPAAAVQAGAQWRYRDGPWLDSGETYVVNFPGPGSSANVEINFRDIDGWRTPDPIRFLLPYGESRSVVSDPYVQPTVSTGGRLSNSNGEETDLFGSQVALNGEWAAITAGNHEKAYVFRFNGEGWLETQQLEPDESDDQPVRFLGGAIDIDGSTIAVGAPGSRPVGRVNSGDVHIFHRFGSDWLSTARVYPAEPEEDESFGRSLALSDRVLVVGSLFKDLGAGSPGAVYVFRSPGSDNDWPQEQLIYPPNPSDKEYFGHAVDVEGDVLVAGVTTRSADGTNLIGAVYVYRFNGSSWEVEQHITSPSAEGDDGFAEIGNDGTPIALSGSRLVVSAPYTDLRGLTNVGAVYVYRYDGGSGEWVLEGELTASDGLEFDRFGTSVSIEGDVVLAGAGGRDDTGSSSGAAYVFRYVNGEWVEYERLAPDGLLADDRLGSSTALSGDRALVGAPYDDVSGVENQGSVYVFDLTYNAPPAAASLTYPADGFRLDLSGDESDTLPVTWGAATDGEGDDLSYVWKLAASASEFTAPMLASEPTPGTSYALAYGRLDGVLAQLGVEVGGSVTLFHRVDVTDGINVTAGPVRSFVVTRNGVTPNEPVPTAFAFRGAYPNPTSGAVRLAFDLPEPATATLQVFDTLGRRVRFTSGHVLTAGSGRQVEIDCDGLSAGVYVALAEFGSDAVPVIARFTFVR